MKAVLQRVRGASVSVDGSVAGRCENGLLILLGVTKGDGEDDASLLAEKIAKLRIFEDGYQKMNLSVTDIGGSALVISNFTLCADYRRGNRPDYMSAEEPVRAKALYGYFCDRLNEKIGRVERGVFGAEMQVQLINEGPVTIVMESGLLKKAVPV